MYISIFQEAPALAMSGYLDKWISQTLAGENCEVHINAQLPM